MEWGIHEVAKAAGTTSRTLRHYGSLGLLEPSRVGANGYRYYDSESILRLQRILLLRELGLGLPVIGEVLERETDETGALRDHVRWLESEHERIERQLVAVRSTIAALEQGKEIDMNAMLDGFDYRQYEDEVAQRWGADAAKQSSNWWESLAPAERAEWQRLVEQLNADWQSLARSDADPTGDEAQRLAKRHIDWLISVPGTPATSYDDEQTRAYVLGLAEMYVSDDRFAANYRGADGADEADGARDGAEFVRDALTHYVSDRPVA